MANNSEQKIWVLIALKPEWLVADVFADVALLFVAVGEFKAIAQAAELPEEIVTIADLFKFMSIAVQLISATASAGTRPADAVLSMIQAFKGVSSAVDIGTAPDVSDTSFLDYLNADGIASI